MAYKKYEFKKKVTEVFKVEELKKSEIFNADKMPFWTETVPKIISNAAEGRIPDEWDDNLFDIYAYEKGSGSKTQVVASLGRGFIPKKYFDEIKSHWDDKDDISSIKISQKYFDETKNHWVDNEDLSIKDILKILANNPTELQKASLYNDFYKRIRKYTDKEYDAAVTRMIVTMQLGLFCSVVSKSKLNELRKIFEEKGIANFCYCAYDSLEYTWQKNKFIEDFIIKEYGNQKYVYLFAWAIIDSYSKEMKVKTLK